MTAVVLAGFFLAAAAQGVLAQDKAGKAKQSVTAKKSVKGQARSPDQAKVTRVKREPFVGPVQPKARTARDVASRQLRAKPGGKQAKGIPEPTIVLKPGEVPAIKFDVPVWDFGRMRAGPDVTHDFWFTNTGTGPLEILKVRPG